jgi:hypothetical protein
VVPSPGLVAGNYYAAYWGANYSQALVDQQFAQAVRVGANLIKGIGSPWAVIDGSQAQAQYLSRIAAWLDTAARLGMFVYFLITDNHASPNTSHRGTLAEEYAQAQALAAVLDAAPNVVGIDLINEVNGWQVQRGGPGSYASSQPDATSVAWLSGAGSLTAAVRSASSKPLACSLYAETSGSLLANTGADWLPLVTAGFDFLDIHPYWPSTSDMTVANLDSLRALYPKLSVFFGEVSVAGFNASTAEVKRRIESLRAFMDKPYVPGVVVYTLDDYSSPGGTGTGMFDQGGAERANMTYPFRTLPRRTRYGGPHSLPLLAPSAALALTQTLQTVTAGRFPINSDLFTAGAGDASYRVTGTAGSGVLQSDVIELGVFDLDTTAGVGAIGSATVSSLANPATADSSSNALQGAVFGGAATAAGKFSNGILLANSTQQVTFADVFRPAGTQPFTVELWFKRARTSGSLDEYLASQWLGGGAFADANWILLVSNDRLSVWWIDGANLFKSIGTLTITDTTTFHHAAVSYDGTTMRLFLDGVANGTLVSSLHASSTSQRIAIGGIWNEMTNWFNGTVDEFRYSNNARYTTAFTPAAAAFTSDANTMLLAHMDTITTGSANPLVTVSSPWTFMPSGAQINAGIRTRNVTAARGSLLNAAVEVRYT